MTNSPYIRAALAEVALELTPPLIRRSLLERPTFREEFGIQTDSVITFRGSGFSIQRSDLFQAVRDVFAGTLAAGVTDVDGREWTLRNEADEGQPSLVAFSDEQRQPLPDFVPLSSNRDARLRFLDRAASNVNLPTRAHSEWHQILLERPLEDGEVDSLLSDLRDSPVHLQQSIRNRFTAADISMPSLVPNSRRYFERLIGVYDGSDSIREFAVRPAQQRLEELSSWRSYEGFLLGLFLSSHSALTAEMALDHISSEDLVKAYDFIARQGDVLSQLGAIEVGLRTLASRPEVESHVLRLIKLIAEDDVEGAHSNFKLFVALFVLVDGEISRQRLLSAEPPFYRRLASLAQAALIHRQLIQCNVDYERFSEWALNSRGEQHFMQSLADMRTEPRWSPDLVSAHQMKANFLGRIIAAGKQFEQNIEDGQLIDLMIGSAPGSLYAEVDFAYAFLPGPLEGSVDSSLALPDDLANFIDEKLGTGEAGPSSLIALANSAMLYKIESRQAELAAQALRLANHRLSGLEERTQFHGIVNGLAIVAAVARNCALADELRTLVRRYRYDQQFGFSIEEALQICLIGSASRSNLSEWRDFAGEWLTELAFDKLDRDEGHILYSCLQSLLHAVPELWTSCGKAEAALKAHISAPLSQLS